ncbi:MAG: DUF2949 domain-containing protein [Cyanobacteria bacterium J007]|nr:MAG: DUF2949 domain-containing protein [Cyanobacteria bacterium J007]
MTNLNYSLTPAIAFLKQELSLSNASIEMALRYSDRECGPLPTILLKYGLISVEQFDRLFTWLQREGAEIATPVSAAWSGEPPADPEGW